MAGQPSCIAWDHRGLKIPRKKNEAIFMPLQTCAYTNTRDSILIFICAYRKLVIIGDGACGKTSLLSVFTLGYFPTVSYSASELPPKTTLTNQ